MRMIVVAQPGGPEDPDGPEIPDGPSTPDGPSAPPVAQSATFGLTLTGVDGSEWDLNSGPVYLAPGAQLFAAPTVSHWWQTAPGINGSRWAGMRAPQADVVLPVFITASDWESWARADVEFWRAVHPSGECTVTVATPDGTKRSQDIRFVAGGDLETNPLEHFFAAYALEFTAASPFWRGEVVSQTFGTQTPLPLFPGPPFTINPGLTTQNSVVTNPGDEAAWPRYRIVGPASSWSVGTGNALVSSSVPLTANQSVTVDMDPTQLSVLDQGGLSVYELLASDVFSAIPSGVDVPIDIALTGTGPTTQVTVEFTPLYRRPFGAPRVPPVEPPDEEPPDEEPPPPPPPPVAFFGVDTDGAVYFDSAGVPDEVAAVIRLDTDGVPYHDVDGNGPGELVTGGIDTDGVPYFTTGA